MINRWAGLLVCFPSSAGLLDGFCGFLGSLARLSGQVRLMSMLISWVGLELTSLLWQSCRVGSMISQYGPLTKDPNQPELPAELSDRKQLPVWLCGWRELLAGISAQVLCKQECGAPRSGC